MIPRESSVIPVSLTVEHVGERERESSFDQSLKEIRVTQGTNHVTGLWNEPAACGHKDLTIKKLDHNETGPHLSLFRSSF